MKYKLKLILSFVVIIISSMLLMLLFRKTIENRIIFIVFTLLTLLIGLIILGFLIKYSKFKKPNSVKIYSIISSLVFIVCIFMVYNDVFPEHNTPYTEYSNNIIKFSYPNTWKEGDSGDQGAILKLESSKYNLINNFFHVDMSILEYRTFLIESAENKLNLKNIQEWELNNTWNLNVKIKNNQKLMVKAIKCQNEIYVLYFAYNDDYSYALNPIIYRVINSFACVNN